MVIPADGTYQLVLVVSDEADSSVKSELYVDNLTGFTLPDLPGDPEPPTVTISATVPSATEDGGVPATFTLTRVNGDLNSELTVEYYVSGSATPGTDYEALTGEVTFAAGSSTATIDVLPIDDAIGELDEDVTLGIGWNSNYVLGSPGWAEVTIVDDDGGIATVGIEALADIPENGGPVEAFVLTRTDGNISGPLTVRYYVYGAATSGEDYEVLSGEVTFAAASSTATITVMPIDDVLGEFDEEINVYLSYPYDGSYQVDWQNSQAESLILDDDGGLTIVANEAATPEILESAGTTAAFTLTRNGGNLSGPLTVRYYVYGTATPGQDYKGLSSERTFAPGQTELTIEVTPIDDAIGEFDESINLYLTYPWDGSYSIDWQNSSAVTMITDNDGGIATVGLEAIVTGAPEEGGTVGAFRLTRTGGNIGAPLTVQYYDYSYLAISGVDYEQLPGEATFAPGETEVIIDLTPIDDSQGEQDEDVFLYLVYPWDGSYQIDWQNYGDETLIIDNDGGISTVGITTSFPEIAEDTGTIPAFTVTRTGGNQNVPLTVEYYVYGYATPGEDYEELSGTVTIEAGASTATIDLTPVDDLIGEYDESVYLYLSYPWNTEYLIDWQNSSAETLIVDNDGGIATVGINELIQQLDETAGTTTTFQLTRTGGNVNGELTVDYYVYGYATAGVDYQELSGTVTFAAGSTTASIDVTPIDDLVGEDNESIQLYLDYSSNGSYLIDYQNWSAHTLIIDNDGGIATVTLTVNATSVEEGGSATFTVTRDGGNLAAPLTVNLEDYSDATPGEDYEFLPESVVIPAGQTSFNFDIVTIDDVLGEWDEQVWLYIDSGDYEFSYPGWAELLILDNDGGIPVVSIEATDDSASENGDTGTFSISRVGGNTAAALTVYFWVYGYAENGVDFTFIEDFAVIPAGETSVTITIEPIDDVIVEGDEEVFIYLDWSNDYEVDWYNSDAWLTIEDND